MFFLSVPFDFFKLGKSNFRSKFSNSKAGQILLRLSLIWKFITFINVPVQLPLNVMKNFTYNYEKCEVNCLAQRESQVQSFEKSFD